MAIRGNNRYFIFFHLSTFIILITELLVKWYFIHYFTHLWIHCQRLGCRDGLGPMRYDSDERCELWKDKNTLIQNWISWLLLSERNTSRCCMSRDHLPSSMLRVYPRSSAVLVISREWGFADTGRTTPWILSVPKNRSLNIVTSHVVPHLYPRFH